MLNESTEMHKRIKSSRKGTMWVDLMNMQNNNNNNVCWVYNTCRIKLHDSDDMNIQRNVKWSYCVLKVFILWEMIRF